MLMLQSIYYAQKVNYVQHPVYQNTMHIICYECIIHMAFEKCVFCLTIFPLVSLQVYLYVHQVKMIIYLHCLLSSRKSNEKQLGAYVALAHSRLCFSPGSFFLQTVAFRTSSFFVSLQSPETGKVAKSQFGSRIPFIKGLEDTKTNILVLSYCIVLFY